MLKLAYENKVNFFNSDIRTNKILNLTIDNLLKKVLIFFFTY